MDGNIGKLIRIANHNWRDGVKSLSSDCFPIEGNQQLTLGNLVSITGMNLIMLSLQTYSFQTDMDENLGTLGAGHAHSVASIEHHFNSTVTGSHNLVAGRLDGNALAQNFLAESRVVDLADGYCLTSKRSGQNRSVVVSVLTKKIFEKRHSYRSFLVNLEVCAVNPVRYASCSGVSVKLLASSKG